MAKSMEVKYASVLQVPASAHTEVQGRPAGGGRGRPWSRGQVWPPLWPPGVALTTSPGADGGAPIFWVWLLVYMLLKFSGFHRRTLSLL